MKISFVSNLPKIMTELGVTVRQLNEASGVTFETIVRARREQIGKCQLETLARIAGVLDCAINELFEERRDGGKE